MASTAEIQAHRADLSALTTLAGNDLAKVFREFDDGVAAREALRDLLPRLVAIYGSAAATLGADWYDELRESQEVPGAFRAIPAELPNRGRTDSLARWGVEPLFGPTADVTSALALVTGGLQRTITDMARRTVAVSAVEDRRSDGWQRVGSGKCDFCSILIGRGAVYNERTVDFSSHDHCGCTAVPAFGGRPRPVKPFTPSLRQSSEADRARVRDFIRANNL